MASYTYLACDLITGNVRGPVDLVGVKPDRRLNSAGDFAASMPLAHLATREQQADRLAATESARSSIVVLRDGVPLGEWAIWQRPGRRNDSSPVQLRGSYITSYFDRVIPSFTGQPGDLPKGGWSQTEQLEIARQLAAQCQDPITSTTAPAGSRGIALSIPPVAPSGQKRDRLKEWADQYKSVGDMLSSMADVINGFDWDIEIALVGQTQVVRTLVLSYPWRGIDAGIVLQPAQGRPGGNASTFDSDEDGTRLATQVIGVGGGEGNDQIISRQPTDPALVPVFPLLQQRYSDASVILQPTMDENTQTKAVLARTSRVPPSITVLADKDPVLGSYRCGDVATVAVGPSDNYPDGYNTRARILTIPIRPPTAGSGPETVTLELGTPPEGM